MFFPAPHQRHEDGNQTKFTVADGFVSFSTELKYLGPGAIIHHTLNSDPDISFKIGRATAAFGALRKTVFSNRLVNSKEKGKIYVAICLTILLYGIESCVSDREVISEAKSFPCTTHVCMRAMCRVNKRHIRRHNISSEVLYQRLSIKSMDSYYNSKLLRWAGHVARMSMDRVPRRLLTGWVSNNRQRGAPQMSFGRTLKL